MELLLISDSAAERGIQGRRGSGRIRHLAGKYLFSVQNKVRAHEVSLGTRFDPQPAHFETRRPTT